MIVVALLLLLSAARSVLLRCSSSCLLLSRDAEQAQWRVQAVLTATSNGSMSTQPLPAIAADAASDSAPPLSAAGPLRQNGMEEPAQHRANHRQPQQQQQQQQHSTHSPSSAHSTPLSPPRSPSLAVRAVEQDEEEQDEEAGREQEERGEKEEKAEAEEEEEAAASAFPLPPRKRKRRSRFSLSSKKVRASSSSSSGRTDTGPTQPDDAYDFGKEYEIERIIARRVRAGQEQYLIHWKGYTTAHDTWEPADNLTLHARQWFHEEMEAGLRDRRTGRLKAAVAKAYSRRSKAREQPHSDSRPTSTLSPPQQQQLDAEGRGPEAAPAPSALREEKDINEQPHSDVGDSNAQQPTGDGHSQSADDSASRSVAVSASPAVGLSATRQRRSIRPPRPYSPSDYVGMTRSFDKLAAMKEQTKDGVVLSDDNTQQSSDGSDGGDEDEEAVRREMGVNSSHGRRKATSASTASKAASSRHRQQLHVRVHQAEPQDVIDLASPAAATPDTPNEPHDSTQPHLAADEEPAIEVNDSPADMTVAAAVDASGVSGAQPAVELTYEVEAVVERRFNAQSIAAGCCVVPVSSTAGCEVGQAAESGYTLLPDDEWDEGCSGHAMQEHTSAGDATSLPCLALMPATSRSVDWGCCVPGFEYRIKWLGYKSRLTHARPPSSSVERAVHGRVSAHPLTLPVASPPCSPTVSHGATYRLSRLLLLV